MTIAGSDSGGGAGLQADLKTFAALGVFGTSVVTAVTAQNTAEVRGVQVVDPGFVDLQIEAVLADLPVAAVKTGMLASSATVAAVGPPGGRRAACPTWSSTPCWSPRRGRRLLDDDGVAAYLELLLPHALVVTPNIARGRPARRRWPSTTSTAWCAAARRLAETGARAVVVKGGHLGGDRRPRRRARRRRGPRPRRPPGRARPTTTAPAARCRPPPPPSWPAASGLLDAVARAKAFVPGALAGLGDVEAGRGARSPRPLRLGLGAVGPGC